MKKPLNVLWLMSDQHNANCLGCAGHPDVRTPCLDGLAANGVRFRRAYCNNPICGPSRSCYLTGQFVKHHGVAGNFIRSVHRDAPNLAQQFRAAGYQTALIGKAHLPHDWVQAGFEHVRLSDLADAAPEDPRTCHYFNELVERGWADHYDAGWLPPGHPGHGMKSFLSELPEDLGMEAWTGREAIAFLKQRDPGRPFFLKVSFQRPHDPYAPPKSRADDYAPQDLALPANAADFLDRGFAGKPAFMREQRALPVGSGYPYRSADANDLRLQMARHFTLVSMIDEEIGKILAALEASGGIDNTLIAYVSDHGDFAGEHGLVLKNLGIYESIHRIPFLFSGPGIPGGIEVDTMVESVDFHPTLLEAAGLEPPAGLDGKSLWSLAQGKSRLPIRDLVVCEWDFPVSPQRRVHAVRDDRYRLVLYDELPDEGELYDCRADPGELHNLYHAPGCREVRDRLAAAIAGYRINVIRVHTYDDDMRLRRQLEDSPTRRLHSRGHKWSEVSGDMPRKLGATIGCSPEV